MRAPEPSSAETARFYYLSRNCITNGSGDVAVFGTDGDTFKLSERLLTLGIIWRWRAQKRLDYAEDLQNYQTALNEEIAKDKGARTIYMGRARLPGDAETAYPRNVLP